VKTKEINEQSVFGKRSRRQKENCKYIIDFIFET